MTNDCLELTKVLKEEYCCLHDFFPEGVATWLFKRDHIKDPAKMVLRLKEVEKSEEPLTERICATLPHEAREQIKQYEQDGAPPESLQNYIVEALNSLLNDPGLPYLDRLPEEWIAEAGARAQMDMTVAGHRPHKPAVETAHEKTREITRETTRESLDEIALEITHQLTREITRDTTNQQTISFNRRLLEIAYRSEIREIQNTLSSVYDHIHQREHAALCLSGGGVRSATFCLGVIQGLAERELLDKFDYLSTVSGGGYIGGWLSAWSHRHPDGLRGVMTELNRGLKRGSISSKEPEPEAVNRLRSFSNYLTPKLGFFSGDTWTLVGTYLRNLLLNWLVLVPLLAAAVILPKLYAGVIKSLWDGASVDAPRWVSHGAVGVGLGLVLLSVLYIGFNRPSTGAQPVDRRERRRGQGRFLLYGLMPLVFGALWLAGAFYGSNLSVGEIEIWHLVAAGAGVKFLGWYVQFPARTRRPEEITEVPAPSRLEHARECIAAVLTGAMGGLLVWKAAAILGGQSRWESYGRFRLYACLAVPLLLVLFLVAETIFIGLVSGSTTDEDREWWARAGGWVMLTAIVWGFGSAAVLFGPDVFAEETLNVFLVAIGSASGISTILIGKSAKTAGKKEPGNGKREKVAWWKSEWLRALLAKWSLALLTPISLVFLIALISKGVDLLARLSIWSYWGFGASARLAKLAPWASHLHVSYQDYPWPVLLILLCGFVLVSLLMALFIDANKFSLNSGYRSRLIRAYLGASRNYRNPNPFTGFDPEDNPAMCELGRRNELGLAKRKLFHVLNLTLNLVRGENLAWQERKAASFTVSPLHCGNHDLGYRSSEEYARGAEPRAAESGERPSESCKPITLGFAMSVSGAVASPNMGYHSSAPVAFLMTLFNVRLGAWLSNPGRCGYKSRGRPYPRSSFVALLYELFGLTNETSPYVYLSDGGHFENLGLYEMVLRRCRYIVVVDAGRDPECDFGDLGNAVRKIRSDLGVPITFEEVNIYPKNETPQKRKPAYCAAGTIGYSAVDGVETGADGKLLYIKPAFYAADEPRDVYEYAKRCEEFPHDSTVDQWFSESQFESYRELGHHILNKISESCENACTIKSLIENVEQKLSAARDEQAGRFDVLGILRGPAEPGDKAGRESRSRSIARSNAAT